MSPVTHPGRNASTSLARHAATTLGCGLAVILCAAPSGAQALPGEQALLLHYSSTTLQVTNGVNDLAAGDLDGDGDLDVVSANAPANQVRVLLNDRGGFTQQSIAVGNSPAAVALADMDADGDLDIVVGTYTQLRLLRNDGAAHFTVEEPVPLPAADLQVVAVIVHDVDGDGALDVIAGIYDHNLPNGSYTGGVLVAFGDGKGQLAPGPTHALPLPAHRIVAADFNGDGHLDVAELGGFVSASRVDVAFGAGDGSFVNSTSEYNAGLYASGLEQGDWDGDGDIDLAAGGKYSLPLFLNDGNGGFSAGQVLNPGYYTKGIAAGDIDRDGDTDLLATSGSSYAMRLYSNNGSGTFTLSATVPTSLQTLSVMLADTNGDGYPDPWSGDYSTGVVTVGASDCLVARYGQAKLNSLGCLPELTAGGSPALGSANFSVNAGTLRIDQPALLLVGLAPAALPGLGGSVLVSPPWFGLGLVTGPGSGNPALCDGTLTLPVGAATLGLLGAGTRLYLQLVSADPGLPGGPQVSLTNGLWFEVAP